MKKKPVFWIVFLVIVACLAAFIYISTDSLSKHEFPIDGSNVATLDTQRVVDTVAKIIKLDDSSQLCVNDDNFDLMFTPDFEWANDGVIRFFYTEKQQTYSSQLRMYHDENKYFITDSSKWPEQKESFKLFHYLNALKYMPQEEIRILSPKADGYSVYMRNDGVPGDYENVLEYSQNGIEEIEGWNIHLEIQPLYEVPEGGYHGYGHELIHIFYSHQI